MKPEFSLEYFKRARAHLLAEERFLKAIRGLRARFSLEGPGGRFIMNFSSGSFDLRESDEPADAGFLVTERGWQKLVGGARTELLVLTRRIRLQGDYLKYKSYLGAMKMILGVVQSGADLPAPAAARGASGGGVLETATPLDSGLAESVEEQMPRDTTAPRSKAYMRPLESKPALGSNGEAPISVSDRCETELTPTGDESDSPVDRAKPDSKSRSGAIFEDTGLPLGVIRLSILQGLGIDQEDLRTKPFIGIANSWAEMNPGHKHLRALASEVKAGVLAAGGIPFEFNVPAPCDCIGNGNEGMRFVLAQRDLIADMIECYARSHWFDGLVTLSSCDKINPGMLMAVARLDIPAICVPGGTNAWQIRFAQRQVPSVDNKDYDDLGAKLDTATSATCGACEIMGTANTVQCLMEALGMALPRSASVPAFHSDLSRFARAAGKRAVEMVVQDLRPSQILTREAFENAVMVDLAIGGSTNTTLHLPAIAAEAGVELSIDSFNRLNRQVPTLCGISPNGPHGMIDFYVAGGVPAVLVQLRSVLHTNCLTVTGETLEGWIERADVLDSEVIRPMDRPYQNEGGTAVLYGSLAPQGAVVKQSSVTSSMRHFVGRAICFDSEAEALQGVMADRIESGHVVVIRYEGPRGAPGMPELLCVTAILDLMQLAEVALVTDGRFSGATHGPCIGHVVPEAACGGPIALVRDGDRIEIDLDERRLTLHVSEAELDRRRAVWQPVVRPVARGYMERYRAWVDSADRGARLNARSGELGG